MYVCICVYIYIYIYYPEVPQGSKSVQALLQTFVREWSAEGQQEPKLRTASGHIHIQHTQIHIHRYIYIYMIYIHTYTYAYTYTYTYTYKHIYVYTYTYASGGHASPRLAGAQGLLRSAPGRARRPSAARAREGQQIHVYQIIGISPFLNST